MEIQQLANIFSIIHTYLCTWLYKLGLWAEDLSAWRASKDYSISIFFFSFTHGLSRLLRAPDEVNTTLWPQDNPHHIYNTWRKRPSNLKLLNLQYVNVLSYPVYPDIRKNFALLKVPQISPACPSDKSKGKTTGVDRLWGFRQVEAPRIVKYSAYESGRVVSPTHQSFLPLQEIAGTHFC